MKLGIMTCIGNSRVVRFLLEVETYVGHVVLGYLRDCTLDACAQVAP